VRPGQFGVFWCILVHFSVFLTFWCILVHPAPPRTEWRARSLCIQMGKHQGQISVSDSPAKARFSWNPGSRQRGARAKQSQQAMEGLEDVYSMVHSGAFRCIPAHSGVFRCIPAQFDAVRCNPVHSGATRCTPSAGAGRGVRGLILNGYTGRPGSRAIGRRQPRRSAQGPSRSARGGARARSPPPEIARGDMFLHRKLVV
jgi:hypothetical protein